MPPDDDYEYRSSGRERRRRGETRDVWEPSPARPSTNWEDLTPKGKSMAGVKGSLGFKGAGADEDLSDEAIAKMSPIVAAGARARRRARGESGQQAAVRKMVEGQK